MLRPPFLCALVVTTTLSACQCGEVVQSLEADIAVEPAAISFSTSIVGQRTQARLQIGNRGTGRLTLAARVEPADVGIEIEAPDEVRAGLAADATVFFTPLARGPFAADVVITSNDPDTPEVRVPVTGEGGPPELVIEPNPIEFGLVNEGVPRSIPVTLSNIGFDSLAVTDIALELIPIEGGGFALGGDDARALGPGESMVVTVSLDVGPTSPSGNLENFLVVTHADGEGRARITAQSNRAPVAVAVEDITRRDVIKVSVGRVVLVDGSDTIDPEGDPFTFTWTLLERPLESTAALIGQGAPETRVTPDVVGRYVVNLRAVDVHGAIGEAQLEILPRDLSVVVTWTGEDNDLDLHVIRPGGVLGDYGTCPAECSAAQCNEFTDDNVDTCRSTGTDASFRNRAPEWGAVGRVDDPRLDIDDVSGGGPEIISVDQPEDGIWRVVVHHCEDPLVEGGSATVRVLEEGVEVFVSGPEPLVQGDAWSAVTMTREQGAWQAFIAGPGIVESQPTLCQ